MKVFNINDSYFKYQKCLSGITYQFINQLDNIYDMNLMVGTNYCTYCMYNEFDIINNFMVNFYQVDICSTINLDLTKRYYEIDGAYLKTGHRVLLVDQNDPSDNDIYNVDTRGFLILSDELSDTGKTWRYKAYVKLGNNKGKQFHLKNTGNRFPLKGERKSFVDGHSYIIKSVFNYDMMSTDSIQPKLIFTDYELARISVNKNFDLYSGFQIPTVSIGGKIDIKYHENTYSINVDNDTTKYITTGVTSGTTIYNYNDPTNGFGYETYIKTTSDFISNASKNDYIKLVISGSTNLYLKTFIKETGSTYIVLSDYIPDNILHNFYTGDTSTYNMRNLMFSEESNIREIMLESFYSKYFDINTSYYLQPIENINNKYFDYDGLIFNINNDIYRFETLNHYIDYKLYERLNEINSYVFNTGFSFLIDYNLQWSTFKAEFYDGRDIISQNVKYWNQTIYPDTKGDTFGTLIKITPSRSSDINYFKNHTYVNIKTSTGNYKTLIVDIIPNEYFVIETYKSNTGLTNNIQWSINTLYNLKEISDILYNVYINDITLSNIDYYRLRDDNMRRNICNGYANFISQDINIINYTTAFLMQDDQHKFILKIYDPENSYNGGVIISPYVVTQPISYPGSVVTSTSATLFGEVINDGGTSITEEGIVWSNSPIDQSNYISGYTFVIGPYFSNLINLNYLNTYYYKAYAKNVQGISFGNICNFTTNPPNYNKPTMTINTVIPTSHKITINASVNDIGFSTITERGIVYITGTTIPTISDNVIVYTPETGGVGSFSIDITGLTHNTVYSYNAYSINVICGITYASSGVTSTLYPSPPVVLTIGYTEPTTYNSIKVLCELYSNDGPINDSVHGINDIGIVWSTDYANVPTTGDTVISYPGTIAFGTFNIIITGLTFSQSYYFRSYAENLLYSGNTMAYGDTKNATTLPLPVTPTLHINTPILSSTYYADIFNIIDSDGYIPIGTNLIDGSLGLYYASGTTVTTGDTFLSTSGITNWTSNLTGLTSSNEYAIMSTVINSYGLTGYSYITGFTTLPVQTIPIPSLSFTTANNTGSTLTGSIISDGNALIINKGVYYSRSTTGTWKIWSNGSGSGNWITNLTGLTNLNTYYAYPYATNYIGTGTGSTITFTTLSGFSPPSYNITSPILVGELTSVIVTTDIVSDGGTSIIKRWVTCSGDTILDWDDSPIINIRTITLTGLTSGGTIYYVTPYASNITGTTTGNTSSFITLSSTGATILINNISDITISGVTVNNQITNNGYSTLIDTGVLISGDTTIWASALPSIGLFSINITGLTNNVSYTGRSYVTNSFATTWSDYVYFTTLTINDVDIQMTLKSSSSEGGPYVYLVGNQYSDIVTFVKITQNSLLLDQLWSGSTIFSSGSTTGLTWGTGITDANNIISPYIYYPIDSGNTDYFMAIESCGYPSEIKSSIVTISAVYPYLTCNRTPSSSIIPTDPILRSWCANGSFYSGSLLPNTSEPMLKKVEVNESTKTYYYNIGVSNNLIYFAHPQNYGLVSSIQIYVGGTYTTISYTSYIGVSMMSSGLNMNWSGILYNVYAFMVSNRLGDINIIYNF